jgi:hypothetical protein
MYWQLRFLRNSLLAATPGYQRIRLAKRKFIPYDGAVDPWTVEQGLRIVEMLRTSGTRIEGATALELGSGWRPVIPLILRAAGARRVYMVDAEQLLDERLLSDTARHLREKAPMLSQRLQVPVESIRATLSSVEGAGLEKATNALGLVYLAPADARRLALEPGDVDIVSSRAVLEHIPREVLEAIFAEFARILVPGRGVMCHIVDNSDHWAHIDKRLSMVNFLKYSERRWKLFAVNPLDYMNRLRHSEYLALVKRSGFDVILDASQPDSAALDALDGLPVSADFASFDRRDLAILTTELVAVRRADATPVAGDVQ